MTFRIRTTVGAAVAVVLLVSGVVAAAGLPVPAAVQPTAQTADPAPPTPDIGTAPTPEPTVEVPPEPSDDLAAPEAAPTAEAEDLVIAGTGLRTLANLVRSSTFFAQLAPSLIFGQLQVAVPAEVLAPLADAYFQAVSAYGEAATGGADAFLAMADAFQAFSPFVNPAASALGNAFLQAGTSLSEAVTDAGEGAGHHNSLPTLLAEYLTSLGGAFGLGPATD